MRNCDLTIVQHGNIAREELTDQPVHGALRHHPDLCTSPETCSVSNKKGCLHVWRVHYSKLNPNMRAVQHWTADFVDEKFEL